MWLEEREHQFELEADSFFREKRWAELFTLAEGVPSFKARLMAAWCLLEQDRLEIALPRLKVLLAEPLRALEPAAYRVWQLRERFGASKLTAWGLHEAVIAMLWSAVTPDKLRYQRPTFEFEWVGAELRAFARELPEEVWCPRPWQLGAAAPVASARLDELVAQWVIAQLERLGRLNKKERTLIEALKAKDERGIAPFRKRRRETPGVSTLKVLHAIVDALRAADVLGLFAGWLAEQSLEAGTALMAELDQLLMVEEVRSRMPSDAASRRASVKRVIFRRSPRRALDVAMVELVEPGQFGTLARHQVPAATPGKMALAMTWAEGTLDEAFAGVPAEHFEDAVKAIREPGTRI